MAVLDHDAVGADVRSLSATAAAQHAEHRDGRWKPASRTHTWRVTYHQRPTYAQ